MNVLELKNLCTDFKTPLGRVRAVDDVSLHLGEKEILGIVGESGCGKSVTALSIMGLLPKGIGEISGGEILFENTDLLKLKEKKLEEIRGNKISMIFQEPMSSLNPIFKIGDQLTEILKKHLKLKTKDAWKRAIDLLNEVGIPMPEKVVGNYPHELSGGMLQRVMIAMAMACKPKVLIADEPTTALDVTIQAQILELMIQLKETNDTSILMITHNFGVVAEVCDRVIVMYAGNIVEASSVETQFDHPAHPYTHGLMKCVPKLDEIRTRLEAIEGMVPPLFNMPKGCRFASRCKYCQTICWQENPLLMEIEPGHWCRCHKYSN